MKYILAQPANERFKWEVQTCVYSLTKLGVKRNEIVLLFTKEDEAVSEFFTRAGYDVHSYSDERGNKEYIASIKPYLWWKYLDEDKRRQRGIYIYIDADTVFRDLIDVKKLPLSNDRWIGSNCNGYLNLDYILRCKNGTEIAQHIANIVGVTLDSIKTINLNSAGAQWVIKQPSAKYWKKVYLDSNKIWKYFKTVNSDIQKWTAEMWAQLWNMMFFNIGPLVHKELDFAWSTDDASAFQNTKILHNAGVTESMQNKLFFKGKYTKSAPPIEDLENINADKCSSIYARFIKEALYQN